MRTYYKPTKWRGKRVVFVSMDPDERRRETRKDWIGLGAFLLFGLALFILQALGWVG